MYYQVQIQDQNGKQKFVRKSPGETEEKNIRSDNSCELSDETEVMVGKFFPAAKFAKVKYTRDFQVG